MRVGNSCGSDFIAHFVDAVGSDAGGQGFSIELPRARRSWDNYAVDEVCDEVGDEGLGQSGKIL
jgi:hypothetical protein